MFKKRTNENLEIYLNTLRVQLKQVNRIKLSIEVSNPDQRIRKSIS